MQCVILAAGRGTRMQPLTNDTPKPLIKVCGKPILEHIVKALPKEIDEIILVVSYLKEQIQAFCGEEFLDRKVKYVVQDNPAGGTGDALFTTKSLIRGRFLFMYADDIHGSEALKEVIKYPYAMLSHRSSEPEKFGVLELNDDNTLKAIYEKPKNPPSDLINIGGMVLDTDIFNYQVKPSVGGEVLVTDMVTTFAKDHSVKVVEQSVWIPVGKPEDIAVAETILCPRKN
ncbi:MAG: Glucose-1-phosphate thymidylyltransferase [Parcubacteria bacterium OLB19]|nr:MAG: Glucose-1-phosphate thymidylyltransferase [Parcubacteria bacterium OLB19]